jgi:hypothetical protein
VIKDYPSGGYERMSPYKGNIEAPTLTDFTRGVYTANDLSYKKSERYVD